MIELDDSFMDRLPGSCPAARNSASALPERLPQSRKSSSATKSPPRSTRSSRKAFCNLLLRLQKEYNITYLFITHDIATVKAISDEIVVMLEGKVVEQGLKSEILAPPFPDYTELLLSSVPEMDPDWLTNLLADRNT
jgi:peptide/nickel transport system ATP-binding protein